MDLKLQLGQTGPIPQNGLRFHPKNTANTHTSDPGTQIFVLKQCGREFVLSAEDV